jgi:hypothetical protein
MTHIVTLSLFTGFVVFVGWSLLTAFKAQQNAKLHMQDSNNMKAIALAFHGYEAHYRKFPPPAITDAEGKPLLSWRVLLLAILGTNGFQFDRTKAWDSPENAHLQEIPIELYRSNRSTSDSKVIASHVFVISIPKDPLAKTHPLFVEGEAVSIEEITDGASNTILAIQLAKHSVPWASPSDLTPDEAYQRLQQEDQGAHAVMADGSIHFLPKDIDRKIFMGLVSRDGGESVQIPEARNR